MIMAFLTLPLPDIINQWPGHLVKPSLDTDLKVLNMKQ